MLLFNSNNYEEAKIEFDKAKGYKDASQYSIRSEAEILISNGEKYKAGLLYGSLNSSDDYLKSKDLLWNDFIVCDYTHSRPTET